MAPQNPFLKVSHSFKCKRRTYVSPMTQKMRQKWLPSYINIFISNRRKLNSEKRFCGAPHPDMLFQTKKELAILNKPGTRKIRQKLKKP